MTSSGYNEEALVNAEAEALLAPDRDAHSKYMNSDATAKQADIVTSPPKLQVPPPARISKKAPELPVFERRNWLIHLHYIKKDYETCKELINDQLEETNGLCEYGLFIKGLILRLEGKIQESLELFQTCAILNSQSCSNLKQVARSLLLFGKHRAAIETYNEASKLTDKGDWEISHNLGAKNHLLEAIAFKSHELTYTILAKLYVEEGDKGMAVDVYKRGVESFPENTELLTSLGLMYLELDQPQKAFNNLGNALTFDNMHGRAINAVGSIMQSHGDYDVALTKYRISACETPESAPLWNNIAMCFFGKKKYVAAISCLKRAKYLSPLDWKILFNLGLVHSVMQQYASAFKFLNAGVSINSDHSLMFLLLAISLQHLDDTENAIIAFTKAADLAKTLQEIAYINLNLALYHHSNNEKQLAIHSFEKMDASMRKLGSTQGLNVEVIKTGSRLAVTLGVSNRLDWTTTGPEYLNTSHPSIGVKAPFSPTHVEPNGWKTAAPFEPTSVFERGETKPKSASVLDSKGIISPVVSGTLPALVTGTSQSAIAADLPLPSVAPSKDVPSPRSEGKFRSSPRHVEGQSSPRYAKAASHPPVAEDSSRHRATEYPKLLN